MIYAWSCFPTFVQLVVFLRRMRSSHALLPQKFLINLFHHPRLFLIHVTLFVLFYHLRTSPQLTLFDVNFRIWVTKFTGPCLQCLSAKRLNAILKCEKLSHLLSTSNVFFYKYECDLFDAGYAGYTSRHLHQRIEVHKSASSSIGQHFRVKHCSWPKNLSNNLNILKKCKANLTAWSFKCFFINELRTSLNVQSDSLRAKVFK